MPLTIIKQLIFIRIDLNKYLYYTPAKFKSYIQKIDFMIKDRGLRFKFIRETIRR